MVALVIPFSQSPPTAPLRQNVCNVYVGVLAMMVRASKRLESVTGMNAIRTTTKTQNKTPNPTRMSGQFRGG